MENSPPVVIEPFLLKFYHSLKDDMLFYDRIFNSNSISCIDPQMIQPFKQKVNIPSIKIPQDQLKLHRNIHSKHSYLIEDEKKSQNYQPSQSCIQSSYTRHLNIEDLKCPENTQDSSTKEKIYINSNENQEPSSNVVISPSLVKTEFNNILEKNKAETSKNNFTQYLSMPQSNNDSMIEPENIMPPSFKDSIIETTNEVINKSLISMISPGSVSVYFVELFPQNSKNTESWRFIDSTTQKVLLIAQKENKLGNLTFYISSFNNPEHILVKLSSNFTRSSFSAIFISNNIEIAHVNFKQQMNGTSSIRYFETQFPLLKQPSNESNSEQTSELFFSDSEIKMRPKQPKIKGGRPSLNFGGRVKMESIKNFILVTDEDPEKNHFVFGKVTQSLFVSEVYHPLTPLQAFAICLTQFK